MSKRVVITGSSVLRTPITIVCPNCKSTIEVTEAKDINGKQENEIGEQYGKPPAKLWIVCPVSTCKCKIDVPENRRDEILALSNYVEWDHSW
jgi:hypothetical protein